MYECRGRQDAESGHQRAGDAPDQRGEQAFEFTRLGRWRAMEVRVLAFEGVDTVERDDVEMDVEIDRGSEPLDERHQAAPGNTGSQPCAARQRRGQCPRHHRSTRVSSGGRAANSRRSGHGNDRTHWRTDTWGNTCSTSPAAVSTIRRAPHDGQNPRHLQLNATRYSCRQPVHSAAWAEAVERGRWAPEVRAHTFNRSHQLMEIMD